MPACAATGVGGGDGAAAVAAGVPLGRPAPPLPVLLHEAGGAAPVEAVPPRSFSGTTMRTVLTAAAAVVALALLVVAAAPAALAATTTTTTATTTTTSTAAAAATVAAGVARPPAAGAVLLLSRVTGWSVLVGSVAYKLPQIVRLARARSGAGISTAMYLTESAGMLLSTVYCSRRAFPFSTWGEGVFILAQNAVILGLLWLYGQGGANPHTGRRHGRRRRRDAVGVAAAAAALVGFLTAGVDVATLGALQVAAIPFVNVGARLPQAALNWRRKGVGEQSVVTLALQWVGNLARVFTTLVQVRDPVVLCGSVASAVVNGVLVGQWVWYTRKDRAAAKRGGRGGGATEPLASR
ncbi:hypothetical protein MMPV_008941 [Pyropia vietnamensis]